MNNMADSIPLIEVTNQTLTDVSGRETLIVNVGGVIFETYRSTLSRMSNGPLVDNNILEEHFRPERNDYFFDRDPDVFKIVVNTLRTGKITIPPGINDPTLKNELIFWGLIQDMDMSGNASLAQTCVSTGNNVHVGTSSGRTNREGVGNKIWITLTDPSNSLLAKLYAGLSYILLCISIFILVAETTPLFHVTRPYVVNSTHKQDYHRAESRHQDTHYAVEIVALVCCLFFVIEYILRLAFAPNRLRFVFSFLGVIDLLAILSHFVLFLISFFVDPALTNFRILKIFRILRILRIFKHFRNIMRAEIIVRALRSSVGELVFLIGLSLVGVLVWATLVYYFENTEYSHYKSIPDAFWLAVVTMTTAGYGDGYGDMIPITPHGKITVSLCAYSGLLLYGLLVSVLVHNMIKVCVNLPEYGNSK